VTIPRAFLAVILPLAYAYVRKQEQNILANGTPLTDEAAADARTIGVKRPDLVRTLTSERVPPGIHPSFIWIGQKLGLVTSTPTIGMALGYAICLRTGCAESRSLLAHELVHVRQYERLGFSPFLRQYIHECLTDGYPHGALEAEARQTAHKFIA